MGFVIRGEDGERLNTLSDGDSVSATGKIERDDGSTDRAWGDKHLDKAFDRGQPSTEEAQKSDNIVESTPDRSSTVSTTTVQPDMSGVQDALDSWMEAVNQQVAQLGTAAAAAVVLVITAVVAVVVSD